MTTEEKLMALRFKQFSTTCLYYKEILFKNIQIRLIWDTKDKTGSISNITNGKIIGINLFFNLLKWNDFYEKQSKRSASRNASRNNSEAQNDIQRA